MFRKERGRSSRPKPTIAKPKERLTIACETRCKKDESRDGDSNSTNNTFMNGLGRLSGVASIGEEIQREVEDRGNGNFVFVNPQLGFRVIHRDRTSV